MCPRASGLSSDAGWNLLWLRRDWDTGSISAKEVVVSSFCVLFGINNVNSAQGMQTLAANLAAMGFGARNAYAMMLFCLLYTPCAATIATIRKETYSTRWTVGVVIFQLVFAWIAATLFFQISGLFIG